MRDTKRIRKILNRFGDLWELFPDMRFSQVVNLIQFQCNTTLFYLEDDILLELIEKTIEQYSNKTNIKKEVHIMTEKEVIINALSRLGMSIKHWSDNNIEVRNQFTYLDIYFDNQGNLTDIYGK